MSEPVRKMGDGAEFSASVRQHIDLVYCTARRVVGDAHLAEDISQGVFIIMRKKWGTLNGGTLPGWLVKTTRLVCREAIRAKLTRQKHEIQAAEVKYSEQPPVELPFKQEVSELLDDALARLNEADRAAVVMRFLQGKSFSEVGAAIVCSEDAVCKRVDRAIGKIRANLRADGVTPSADGLLAILVSQCAAPTPPDVAESISRMASVRGAELGHTTLAGLTRNKMFGAGAVGAGLLFGGLVAVGVWVSGGNSAPPVAVRAAAGATGPSPMTDVTTSDGRWNVKLMVVQDSQNDGATWTPDGTILGGNENADSVVDSRPKVPLRRRFMTRFITIRKFQTWPGVRFSVTGESFQTFEPDRQLEFEDGQPAVIVTDADIYNAGPTTELRYEIADGPWQTELEVSAAQSARAIPQEGNGFRITASGLDPLRGYWVRLRCPATESSFHGTPGGYAQRVVATLVDGTVFVAEGEEIPNASEYLYRFPLTGQGAITGATGQGDVDPTLNAAFLATPFADALDFIHDVSGEKIVIDWTAVKTLGIDRHARVNYSRAPLSRVMRNILEQISGGKLTYTLEKGRVNILAYEEDKLKSVAVQTQKWSQSIEFHNVAVIPGDKTDFKAIQGNVTH